MDVNCSKIDDKLVIKIDGEIDHHSSEKIRKMVDSNLDSGLDVRVKKIIFDFSEVNFMDSSGIGMIIGRYKSMDKLGGTICIASMNDELKRIYEISGLHKIITCFDDVEHALKS